MGAVSGTAYHAAAKGVVSTITSAADWGDVTAGEYKLTIEYTKPVPSIVRA